MDSIGFRERNITISKWEIDNFKIKIVTFSYIFVETILLEIDKCESKNAASVSVRGISFIKLELSSQLNRSYYTGVSVIVEYKKTVIQTMYTCGSYGSEEWNTCKRSCLTIYIFAELPGASKYAEARRPLHFVK